MFENDQNYFTIAVPYEDKTKKYPDWYIKHALVLENELRNIIFISNAFILDLSVKYVVDVGLMGYKFITDKDNRNINIFLTYDENNRIQSCSYAISYDKDEINEIVILIEKLKTSFKNKSNLIQVINSTETKNRVIQLYFLLANKLTNYFHDHFIMLKNIENNDFTSSFPNLAYDCIEDCLVVLVKHEFKDESKLFYFMYKFYLDDNLNLLKEEFEVVNETDYKKLCEKYEGKKPRNQFHPKKQFYSALSRAEFKIHKLSIKPTEEIGLQRLIELYRQKDQTLFHKYLARNLNKVIEYMKINFDLNYHFKIMTFESFYEKLFDYHTLVFAVYNDEEKHIYFIRTVLDNDSKIRGILQIWKEKKETNENTKPYNLDEVETRTIKVYPGESVNLF
jgi:hypothetical protein